MGSMSLARASARGAMRADLKRRMRRSGERRSRVGLKLLRLEGVAAADLAAFQSALEPAHPLRRGAVGKGIGHDIALGLLLQRVVTDRGGGIERGFHVAAFQD